MDIREVLTPMKTIFNVMVGAKIIQKKQEKRKSKGENEGCPS